LLFQIKDRIVDNHGSCVKVENPNLIILELTASQVSAVHELFHVYFDTREPCIKNSDEFFCEYLALTHSKPEATRGFNREAFLADNQLAPDQFLAETDGLVATIVSNKGMLLQKGIEVNSAYLQRYLAAWRYFKDGEREIFSTPWQSFMARVASVDAGKAAVLGDLRSILVDAPDVADRVSVEARVTEALIKTRTPPENRDCSIYHIDYDF
jgi:hypothetical protein